MAGRCSSMPPQQRVPSKQQLRAIDENRFLSQSSQDASPNGNNLVLPGITPRNAPSSPDSGCRAAKTPEQWPKDAITEVWADMVSPLPRSASDNSFGMGGAQTPDRMGGDLTPEPWPEYKSGFGLEHEFCIKLSMANIEGRPLSVTLARVGEPDTPLIGCSPGFLALCGRPREEVLGRNARFLNQRSSMTAESRHRLQYSVKTGMPFMGLIGNRRHAGGGVFEDFENLMHLVVIAAGNRKYFLGIQADVTGLNLNLDIGGRDAKRLQSMFDAVLSAQVDSWIHIQEGALHTLPLYLFIRINDSTNDEDHVELVEGALCGGGPALAAPDQYLVLAPQFSPEGPTDVPLMWQTHLLGSVSRLSMKDEETPPARPLGPPSVGDKLSSQKHARPLADPVVIADKAPQNQGQHCPYSSSPKDSPESGWANSLETLGQENPACILVARGITKLGLESGAKLRKHFTPLCGLKDVQVPVSFKKKRGGAKKQEGKPQEQRVAGRCFIVMNFPAEARRILAQGPEYVVDGVVVTVEPFNPQDS